MVLDGSYVNAILHHPTQHSQALRSTPLHPTDIPEKIDYEDSLGKMLEGLMYNHISEFYKVYVARREEG